MYKKQHEQQKHETRVIINRAAAAPSTIPTYTVKLKLEEKNVRATLLYCDSKKVPDQLLVWEIGASEGSE